MKFKVVSSDVSSAESSNAQSPHERIEAMVTEHPVFLFMKGTPEQPQCGFSYKVCSVLHDWGVSYHSFNILSDESIRQGVKDYSDWQTFPQLYVNSELIGGCDIIESLSQNKELGAILQKAFPDQEFNL